MMSLPEPRGTIDLVARIALARRAVKVGCDLRPGDLMLMLAHKPTKLCDLIAGGHFSKGQATGGLVEVLPDAEDGRGIVVSPTDAGRKHLYEIRKRFHGIGAVDATEIATLCEAADRMAALVFGNGKESAS